MGRRKGSTNQQKLPAVYLLSDEQRLELIARLLIEIVSEEQNEA